MIRSSLAPLRARLLALVLLAILPALSLAAYSAWEERQSALAATDEELLDALDHAAAHHLELLAGARQFLTSLAHLPQVRERDPEACSAFLGVLNTLSPSYANLGVADPSGHVFCSALPLDRPVSMADRSWFRDAASGTPFVVDVHRVGRIAKRPILGLAEPVFSAEHRLQAVVFGGLDLGWFRSFAARSHLPEGAVLAVIDRDGAVLLASPDGHGAGGRILPDETLAAILRLRGGLLTASGSDGTPHRFAVGTLGIEQDRVDFHLTIGVPEAVILAPVNAELRRDLLWLAVASTLVLGVAWFSGGRFVLRPVDRLVSFARRIAEGDLSARTDLTAGVEEFRTLGQAFDAMAEALQEKTATVDRTLQALDESEARFRTAFEGAAIGMSITGLDGRILRVNRSFARMLGYAEGDLVGRSYEEITHPEDREASREGVRAMAEGRRVTVTLEKRYLRKDESVLWARLAAAVVHDGEGSPGYVIGQMEDITDRRLAEEELRLSEQRFRQLFAHAPISIWEEDFTAVGQWLENLRARGIRDLDAHLQSEPQALEHALGLVRLVDVNETTLRLFEIESKEELLDSWGKWFTEETFRVFSEELTAIWEGRNRIDLECSAETARGRPIHYQMHWVAPWEEGRMNLQRVIVAIADVTEHKQVQEALREAGEEVRHLAARIAEVQEAERAHLADELHDRAGQDLSALGMSLGVLRRQLPAGCPEGFRSRLEDCVDLTERASRQVRTVMAELRPPSLDHFGLLASLRSLAAEFSLRTGVRVLIEGGELDPRLPPGLELVLFRTVQEALANVAKHAGADEVIVRLEAPDDTARVIIADDGAGFAPKGHGRRGPEGGWGLAILRERLGAAGGRLEVRSAPGSGTEIAAEVPR